MRDQLPDHTERRIATVRGDITADQLGMVLMHEHLLLIDPEYEINRSQSVDLAQAKLRALHELEDAWQHGVRTIVDLTVWGLGRNIQRVQVLNDLVDLNIIVGTGFYTWRDLPLWTKRVGPRTGAANDTLTELFIAEVEQGIGETGIRAGILKCVTEKYGLSTDVSRIVRAVSHAHVATGAPIATHAHAGTRRGVDQLEVFRNEGVDLRRVLIGHCGDTDDYGYLAEIASSGAYVGLDRFGMSHGPDLNDRVATVIKLCEMGHSDKIILSADFGVHATWEQRALDEINPMHSYSIIPRVVLPRLRAAGLSESTIDKVMQENPQRLLCGQSSSEAGNGQ